VTESHHRCRTGVESDTELRLASVLSCRRRSGVCLVVAGGTPRGVSLNLSPMGRWGVLVSLELARRACRLTERGLENAGGLFGDLPRPDHVDQLGADVRRREPVRGHPRSAGAPSFLGRFLPEPPWRSPLPPGHQPRCGGRVVVGVVVGHDPHVRILQRLVLRPERRRRDAKGSPQRPRGGSSTTSGWIGEFFAYGEVRPRRIELA
jgi:hypothetical protein